MEKENTENLKKKAQKTAIAATTAASLFVNNTYETPLEIIEKSYEDEDFNEHYNQKKKNFFKVKIKQILYNIPQSIRMVFLLPLWSLGWLLMLVFRPIWENLLVGFASEIGYWLILGAILLVIVLVSTLIAFPGLPLSKTFNKKTISLILVLLIVLAISDKLLTLFYPAYSNFKRLVKVISCIFIVIISLVFIHFKTRKLKFKVTNDKYTFSN
ncbi:MAG TPA: hypothetical protein PLT36_03305 [Erysipelotrichaceae bacterium]|jgi:hypothetical protein|nr:hypothetical protein [Erysipelotrichaceae bacterium]HQA85208.1 hypothetical protein [Erysipelotrichaceae bacterium]